MELHHHYFFILFSLAFVASHAANLSPEVYWKVKLPNTPIPRPIKDALLYSEAAKGDVQKLRQPWGVGSWYQSAAKGDVKKLRQPWGVGSWYQAAAKGDVHKLRQPWGVGSWYQSAAESDVREFPQPWGVGSWYQAAAESQVQKLRKPWGVGSWYQAAAERDVHKLRQPWGVGSWYREASKGDIQKIRQPYGVFRWYNSATVKDHNENLPITPYFFETDLYKGKKMNLPSLKNHNPAPILPRKVADSIPFSSDKIEEIMNHFSVDKDSESAQMIKKTIKMCEDPAGNGEDKYCATSLESMVDFTSSYLGTNNIIAMSTVVEKETPEVQTYTIEEVKEIANGKGVICHKVAYPYAVHFCHSVGSTRTFMVSMVGSDGTKVNAVTECHEDTASMNPKALPFQLLNVKPGDKPICHFILDDQISLVPNSQDATDQVANN